MEMSLMFKNTARKRTDGAGPVPGRVTAQATRGFILRTSARRLSCVMMLVMALVSNVDVRGAIGMDKMNESDFGGQDKAIVQLDDREVTITLEEAQEIRRALKDYLDSTKEEFQPPLPKIIGEAWIDGEGYIRMGGWLLESGGDNLVLTYRLPSQPIAFGYKYVATLEKDTGNKWKVRSISRAKLMFKRE
jgi:hypothetical protein